MSKQNVGGSCLRDTTNKETPLLSTLCVCRFIVIIHVVLLLLRAIFVCARAARCIIYNIYTIYKRESRASAR